MSNQSRTYLPDGIQLEFPFMNEPEPEPTPKAEPAPEPKLEPDPGEE